MQDRHVAEEIKERLPIEQLIGTYVPLKKAGRIYKGLCPFHSEKTPSFTVSPDRGVYKCFGCGKGGDIFDFVMETEGLTFPEAIKLLGDKAGVEVPEWKPSGESQNSNEPRRTRLFELNGAAARLWNSVLINHPKADGARTYLASRGVSNESITTFQIGYAPYGNGTETALLKAGFSRAELRAAGDPAKFQDRITFPIADLTGKIVGFTGRLLELKDDPRSQASPGPKYWNTPETPVFIKSKTLYALHLAKHAIQKEELAILTEGQMDVVMLHQGGYPQTVASSGTALTLEQLRLLRRFTPTIAFAYDGDTAGIAATKRGVELALQQDLNAYVIVIPNGKDPAECLQKNPNDWAVAYTKRVRAFDWIIDQELQAASRPLQPEIKKKAAKELVRWLGYIQDPTEQADWFTQLAAKLETNEYNLRELFKRVQPNASLAAARETEMSPVVAAENRTHSLSDTALAILMSFPETFIPLRAQFLALDPATLSPEWQKQFPYFNDAPASTPIDTYIYSLLSDDERKKLSLYIEGLLQPYADIDVNAAWAITELTLILQRSRADSHEDAKARISAEIGRAQQLGDTEKVRHLFQELQNLL